MERSEFNRGAGKDYFFQMEICHGRPPFFLGELSPCIDAGENAAVPSDILDLDNDSDTAEPLPYDLDGNPRFIDDPATTDSGSGVPPIVDMGAYEYYSFDLDGDGIPDEQDHCPALAAQESVLTDYTGDLLIAIDETGVAAATLSAVLTYEKSDPLVNVPISFSVSDSGGILDGECSATTDGSGKASCSPANLAPDVYTVMVESKPGCPAAPTEALLVVYDPNVPRATGGGFILPDESKSWGHPIVLLSRENR